MHSTELTELGLVEAIQSTPVLKVIQMRQNDLPSKELVELEVEPGTI